MSDTLSNALSDPGVSALLGLAQGFGNAALPTRMPTLTGFDYDFSRNVILIARETFGVLPVSNRACSVDGCGRKHFGCGLCNLHYKRQWKIERASTGPKCLVDGCQKAHDSRGYCVDHYMEKRRSGFFEDVPLCSVLNCSIPVAGRGYCHNHLRRVVTRGDPMPDVPFRVSGGGCVEKNGYRTISVLETEADKRGRKSRQVLEHRHIMQQSLGRPLLPGETVHHIDGDRLNNMLENLELWRTSHPSGQRVEDHLRWARETLAVYGDLVERAAVARGLKPKLKVVA